MICSVRHYVVLQTRSCCKLSGQAGKTVFCPAHGSPSAMGGSGGMLPQKKNVWIFGVLRLHRLVLVQSEE